MEVEVDFSKLRVLIVENHSLMRKLLTEMLRGFGTPIGNIHQVRDVPEAIDLIYGEIFDIVILDFFLGDMDGSDFTYRLRRDAKCPNRKVPILLITAEPEHGRVLRALDSGVNDLLAKPIMAKDLYRRIYAMIAFPTPFIISRKYVGPSRRKKDMPDMAGNAENIIRRTDEPSSVNTTLIEPVAKNTAKPKSSQEIDPIDFHLFG